MALKFPLRILSLRGIVFEEEVESVYIFGADGEFELLAYHFPLLAEIPEGEIQIAHHDPVPIKVGVIMFKDNKCTVICETDTDVTMKKRWDDIT